MRHIPATVSWLALLGLSMLMAAWPVSVLSENSGRAGFTLVSGNIRTGTDVHYLDARYDATLTADANDALDNGVPLTLELQVRVTRPRRWWWDAELVEFSQRQELRYHALSRRYVVHNHATGDRRIFFRRDVAVAAWSTLESVPLLQRRQLEHGQRYEVEARVRLDLDALPHPLRTVAFVSPEWRLVSDWYKWPLEG